MLKALALFGRKKTSRPFKDYYAEWIDTLKNTLLPQLRRSMLSSASSPTLLAIHVEAIHYHFRAYYEALDLAASHDVAQLLFPDWRNSLEKPFLWLGDLHPYLFTNLLRLFLDEDKEESKIDTREPCAFFDKPWCVEMAWKSPPKTLTTQVEQIECGMRLMVPALVARARNAQARFVDRVGIEWASCVGRKEETKSAVGEAVTAEMEVMVSVFLDANRLRRSILADILNVTSVYQAAQFFEGLAQFLVGFRDHQLLRGFERAKMPIS